MRVLQQRAGAQRWLGAALTVLAGVLLAPAAARAGCGDHVVVVPRNEHATPLPAFPVVPANKHAPCSSPHCRRAPLAPAPAPVAPAAQTGQQWACIAAPPTLPRQTAATHCDPQDAEQLRIVPSSIYHPPR